MYPEGDINITCVGTFTLYTGMFDMSRLLVKETTEFFKTLKLQG